MKILPIMILVGLSIVTLQAFSIDQESSSTPENAMTYSYTDNTLQLQFVIPVIIAIISTVAGMAIYAGTRKK
ncbi:MAG: hypothetical protein KGH95_03590 [Thaumarchaeota archaeon]|nr:hypothetical protein [Nitrososphaerota archaeon]